MTQERLPEFFDRAPTLTVQDPLAAFLGAGRKTASSLTATPMPCACADIPARPSRART